MSTNALLFGILPLLAFVIMDSFFGMKSGLMAAVLLAGVELFYTLVKFGTIDSVTALSVFTVVLMSFLAWKKESEKIFLFQPVIISFFFGAYFTITYFMNEPILIVFFDKYAKDLMTTEQFSMMNSPLMRKLMEKSTLTNGLFFFVHAGCTWFAAIKLNKWWWIAVRGIGFYFFMFLGMLCARFLI